MKITLPLVIFGLLGAALAGVVIWPQLDLVVSGWFYNPGYGFELADNPVLVGLHIFAVDGAWVLGDFCVLFLAVACLRRKGIGGLRAKGWLFLLLGLLIGPVLIANAGFKDHWGRFRPREVSQFGGWHEFTPALMPQATSEKNGSFVSGDGAFGFYLPSFAYLVPSDRKRKESKRAFWIGMGVGGAIAFARIAMGGHFLSDNLFACLFMLLASAGLHAAMYGRDATKACWRVWLGIEE